MTLYTPRNGSPFPAIMPLQSSVPSTLDGSVLQEINCLRLVARVVSNAAHDINNALQVIGGSAELLALKSTIGPAEQRRIESIGTQTTRAATVLDRLSAYTRGDAADGRVVADLGELAETAVALRDFTLNRARIAVTIDRNGSPPHRAGVARRSILQVLLNLLVNAEDALKNRRDGSIQITVVRTGPECRVSVADNGPGISPEARVQALEVDTPPALGPDLSGIGLWVSKRIADQHGGRLDITASESGTSATLTLPSLA